ncbi:hypothetical protein DPX16_18282 [Anabarilius grahami]|uniref:Uncharacterized protein n=1 Tax=Anabarilius grahami TaxID=495550 RepID=A0A3N0YFF7_ANAGA|nr:hypothetical protein DPX16_18282 [Anabarilius grahami]
MQEGALHIDMVSEGQERPAPAISHKKHELLKELLLSAKPKPADLTKAVERLECTAQGKQLRQKFHGVYESELQAKALKAGEEDNLSMPESTSGDLNARTRDTARCLSLSCCMS